MYLLVARVRMAKTPNNGALTQACSVLTHTILGTLVIMLLGLRTMKLWQRSFVSSKYYSLWHAYLDSLCLLYQAKRFPYPSSQPALLEPLGSLLEPFWEPLGAPFDTLRTP